MAKIKVLGSAMVIISSLKTEAINTIKAHAPKLSSLYNEDKEPIFTLYYGPSAGIGASGVIYDETTENGYAQLTINIGTKKQAETIKEEYAVALTRLNVLETEMAEAYSNILAQQESALAQVEFVGMGE